MIGKTKKRIASKWIFLIISFILYFIIFFASPDLFKKTIIQFLQFLKSIVPVVVAVFALTFLSNLFLDVKKIMRFLGKEAGLKGWVIAITAGILSMGPIYMWYPVLKDLREKGMENSFITVFLYNRAVKIPLLPMMIYYFGLNFTLVLIFYMILFSIINGMLMGKIFKHNDNVQN